jgi:hypothetical protein
MVYLRAAPASGCTAIIPPGEYNVACTPGMLFIGASSLASRSIGTSRLTIPTTVSRYRSRNGMFSVAIQRPPEVSLK